MSDFESRVQLAEERAASGQKEISAKLDVIVAEMIRRTDAITAELRHRTDDITAEMRHRSDAIEKEMKHQSEAISALSADVKNEYRSTRTTIIVTGIGSVVAILGIMLATQANLLSAFQTGFTATTIVTRQ